MSFDELFRQTTFSNSWKRARGGIKEDVTDMLAAIEPAGSKVKEDWITLVLAIGKADLNCIARVYDRALCSCWTSCSCVLLF